MPSHVEKAVAWIRPFYERHGSSVPMCSGKRNTEREQPSITAR